MQLLPNGLLVAPLHTYIHALADVFKRPDLPMALPKSTLAPTNIVGNDAVKALLFYFQSFHASSVEFHILVFTTKVYKY